MQRFIIQPPLSGIELKKVGREDFCFAQQQLCSVLLGLQKSLQPDSQKFVSHSLVRTAADSLPCLSYGFGFLLFDGETVAPGVGRLRNRSIINNKKQQNSFARLQLQTR